MKNRKSLWIVALSVSATLLGAAHWYVTPARAQVSVMQRDVQMVTAKVSNGGDALYILDGATQQIAVFTYDPTSRAAVPRAIRPVADAFVQR
jgi:hypothetical protein